MEQLDLYDVRKVIFRMEQLGVQDKEFKVDTVRLIILLDILKQIVEKYDGSDRLQNVIERIKVAFPETEYNIPIVGRVSFFSLVYGEVSYMQKIKYTPLHVIIVKAFRSIESKKDKKSESLVDALRDEIYKLWMKIDEKYIEKNVANDLKSAYKQLYTLIDEIDREKLPINIANENADNIADILDNDIELIKRVLNIYRDTLVVLPEIKKSLKFEQIEIPLINAVPRYPATDLESKYAEILKEKIIQENKKAMRLLEDIEDLIKMLPHPNVLAKIVDLLSEKDRNITKPLVVAYSKAYVDLLDDIFFIKDLLKKK